MCPNFPQRRARHGNRCGLLPPLLLLLLASQLPVADAQECSFDNQRAITTKCGGALLGVCCYPMENTPSGRCAGGCKGTWGKPACGSGCSTSDATTGVMPDLGQVCCLPTSNVDDDADPGEHNVIVYPAAAVGVLFLLVSCYCYLRSPRRQSSAMESRADQLLRTAFLRGQDKTLMSRKADRSVWERHWSTPMKGEDGGGDGGGGGTDDDYEEGQYVWRRRGGGGHNRGSEHGSIDSVGSAVLEGIPLSGDPDFDELDGDGSGGGPRSPSRGANGSFVVTPPPRRRGQGLRKQGWVRHFIDKASGKSGGTPKGGGERGKHDPAAVFRNVKLEWRPAMDPAPSADPVNPAPSRALRQELSDIESRPFSEKVQWFYGKCRDMAVSWDEGHVEIRCRRNALLEDAIAQFKRLNREDWRKIFRFSFVGEPALDAGGVSREWFETVSEAMFCMEERGLFCPSDDSGTMLQIAPPLEDPAEESEKLALLTFCGEVMGKAVFDRRIIHAPLILPLFKHVVAAPITLRDLQSVDAEVYRSLLKLLAMDEENLSAMCLDFTVTRTVPVHAPPSSPQGSSSSSSSPASPSNNPMHPGGDVSLLNTSNTFVTVELTPGGSGIDVDSSNVEEYVQLRLQDRMLHSVNNRLAAFLLGIYAVVPQHLLSIFDYMELELLVGGMPSISLADWKLHTVYAGDFTAAHEVVVWFWKTVEEFEPHEQAKLLQFVTGSSRMPTHGFEALQGSDGRISKFCLVSIPLSVSVLPKSSTCFNRLYLPMYEGIEQLQHFLRITTALDVTGFGME